MYTGVTEMKTPNATPVNLTIMFVGRELTIPAWRTDDGKFYTWGDHGQINWTVVRWEMR